MDTVRLQSSRSASRASWRAVASAAYDRAAMMTNSDPRARPGLAKVRPDRLFSKRHVTLVRLFAGRCHELFEAADIVSEGCAREEASGAWIYYGSTSLVIARKSIGASLAEDELPAAARFIGLDPHARLYAVRIARREAWTRASAALGPLSAEIDVGVTRRGIELSVEVSAPLDRDYAGPRIPSRVATAP